MKKAVLLLAALFITQASHAYVEEFTTTDIKNLQASGYSQETLKVIDTARFLTQGAVKDYVPFYPREFYSKYQHTKWYEVAKRYLDPVQDDNLFGVREISFTNDWFDLRPSYFEFKTPNDRYQRLKDKNIKRLEWAGRVIEGSNGVKPKPYEDSEYVIEDL